MARMHSRRRGKSGSRRPVHANVDWVEMDADEVEDKVQELADKGLEPAEIGLALRDEYDVPSVKAVTGKKVTDIAELKHEFPSDLRQLMQTAISLRDHLDQNSNDLQAKRQLQLTEAKIRRLANYYRGDEIPGDWKYNIEKARLVVE